MPYKNIEDKRKNNKEYSTKFPETKAFYTRRYLQRLRSAILGLLGGKCFRCPFSDERALQIDHVNGGGAKEIREMKGIYYKSVLKSVMNQEGKYQILCANCNWIKRAENQEFLHKYKR